MSVLKYFEQLGAQIERAFREVHYDETRFPDIASEALTRTPAHLAIREADLLHEVAGGAPLPPQLAENSNFGEPPITVFARERFVIDVYFWFDGTTSTHEHGFCGAFQVLSGSSLHAIRRFECSRRVNSHFLLGDVRTERCEVLNVGDTRQILPGRTFAHALFHLAAPSTTVVVRTWVNPDAKPQYTYAPPFVAFDPFYKPRAREVQRESLRALARVDNALYLSALDAALKESTLETAYFLLAQHGLHCLEKETSLEDADFDAGFDACERRHGRADTEKLVECVRHQCRVRDLVESRRRTVIPDERFLLAVLLNAHDRSQVLEFMRARYPEEQPTDSFMRLFARIAAPLADDGVNVLGVEIGADAMTAIRLLLEGIAPGDLHISIFERHGRVASSEDKLAVESFLGDLLEVPAVSVLGR